MLDDQVIFIVDLNEVENDNELPVSMDYTCNSGAGVLNSRLRRPAVGEWVLVHSDDDDTLYYAKVLEDSGARDLLVGIDWTTRTPVLNTTEWSARNVTLWDSYQAATAGPERVRVEQ